MTGEGTLPLQAFLPQLQVKRSKQSSRIGLHRFGLASVVLHQGELPQVICLRAEK